MMQMQVQVKFDTSAGNIKGDISGLSIGAKMEGSGYIEVIRARGEGYQFESCFHWMEVVEKRDLLSGQRLYCDVCVCGTYVHVVVVRVPAHARDLTSLTT